MKILSIDIGIINLGYVFAELDTTGVSFESNFSKKLFCDNYFINKDLFKECITVIDCNRVDITKIKHDRVRICDCKLHHEQCIPDYLDHFIQELEYFETADQIIIERQPPVGITNVQDLIFTKFRSKVQLISPNSIHKYFGMDSEYSIRKEQSERISTEYLVEFNSFNNNYRKHDISDALLMIVYYLKMELEKKAIKKLPIVTSFDQFRFIPEKIQK